jgi:hypothetical protein
VAQLLHSLAWAECPQLAERRCIWTRYTPPREPDPSEPPSYRADAGAEGAALTGSVPVSAAFFRATSGRGCASRLMSGPALTGHA